MELIVAVVLALILLGFMVDVVRRLGKIQSLTDQQTKMMVDLIRITQQQADDAKRTADALAIRTKQSKS